MDEFAKTREVVQALVDALKLAMRKEPNETPGGFTKEWVRMACAAIAQSQLQIEPTK